MHGSVAERGLTGGAEPRQTNLFVSGEEGHNTYRIPAVVVSKAGTILAFCEGRVKSNVDGGDINLVLRRSVDGGETWGPLQVIQDEGVTVHRTGSPEGTDPFVSQCGPQNVGNACPVVDRETGAIWLPFSLNNDRVFVTKSTDDGASWTPPEDITEAVKRPQWGGIGPGPGHGLQLSSGRLAIPCWSMACGAPLPLYGWQGLFGRCFCFYSDDHGASWQSGGIVPGAGWGDECSAVETATNDEVYLSIRANPYWGRRACAWSRDGAKTWDEVQWALDVPEGIPYAVQGSVVRLTDGRNLDRNRVLLSNAAGPVNRVQLTVRVSYDECRSWNAGKVLWPGPAGYSDLCVLPDLTIGCLYEAGEQATDENVKFARFDLEWLTDGADRLAKTTKQSAV